MTGCAVADCKFCNKNPAPPEALQHVPVEVGFRMIRFPDRHNPNWKNWISKTGRPMDNFLGLDKLSMCSIHFAPEMFNMNLIERLRRQGKKVSHNVRALLPSAVPTLKLPIAGSKKCMSESSKRMHARQEKDMQKRR
jgi:THAP domain